MEETETILHFIEGLVYEVKYYVQLEKPRILQQVVKMVLKKPQPCARSDPGIN